MRSYDAALIGSVDRHALLSWRPSSRCVHIPVASQWGRDVRHTIPIREPRRTSLALAFSALALVLCAACERTSASQKAVADVDGVVTCCEGRGVCLAPSRLPPSLASQLGDEGCSAPASCAPRALLDDLAGARHCLAAGEIEGRCLPDCLPHIADRADVLEQRNCQPHELRAKPSSAWRPRSDAASRHASSRLATHCCSASAAAAVTNVVSRARALACRPSSNAARGT
jgi:hypothetical protein